MADFRFPPPEFESGHALPLTVTPPARALALEYLDVAVLAVALAVGAYLVLKARSRRGVLLLGLFSLIYFGFWRKGCVCAIGSIQNVAGALALPHAALPFSALAFFLLPLVFALFFGRTFCAAVCPHGALQDLLLLKPIAVPAWLEQALKLAAYAYLGLAVLFAATGAGYIICQYDPFVGVFRLSGPFGVMLFGVGLLLLGVFVGRPYCRFLCPYGVLLGLAGAVSKLRVRITPDICTNCRLCERSCPYGAIDLSDAAPRRVDTVRARRRLAALILLAPALIALGAWLGHGSAAALARKHRAVRLADEVRVAAGVTQADALSDAVIAFRGTGRPPAEAVATADAVRARMAVGAPLFGAWMGLVVAAKLIVLAARGARAGYEANRATCVACARCYRDCPQDQRNCSQAWGSLIGPVGAG